MADNGKINHEKGMFCAAARAFPFLKNRIKGMAMDKRKAIQIMARAATLYHADLEDQKILFLYRAYAEVTF